MHHTKTKGDIGVGYVIASLIEQGWNVSIPISEHQSYDLIAEKFGKMYRVQVKYTSSKNNICEVRLYNSWVDKHGIHHSYRNLKDYEILAVYNPDTKETYFINSLNFKNKNSISFRNIPPNRKRKIGIRMAKDFLTLN